ARLAGPAAPGDTDDRRASARAGQGTPDLLGIPASRRDVLEQCDGAGDLGVIAGVERPRLVSRLDGRAYAGKYIVHHPVEAQPAPILRCVDALDAVALQRFDLVRRDGPAATHDDADVLAAALPQHVHHVREVFVVTALIRACRDRIRILLDRGSDDVSDAAVVAQVDHLGAVC